MTDIHEKLAELEANAAQAESAWRAARDEADRAVAGAIRHPAVAAVREYEDAKVFRKRGVDTSRERGRALVGELCDAITRNPDLTLTSIGASRFRVDDLGPARRAREARAAMDAAGRKREQFKLEHAAEFEAAREATERSELKAALDEGDRQRLRELLGVEQRTPALTTADFQS